MPILETVPESEIYYSRQRHKNRVFAAIVDYLASDAKHRRYSRRDIAEAIGKDPAQITRWLSHPSNLTIETISDILTAVGAELETRIVPIKGARPNYIHPLLAQIERRQGGSVALQNQVLTPSELARAKVKRIKASGNENTKIGLVDA